MAVVQRLADTGFPIYNPASHYDRWSYIQYTPVFPGPTYHYVAAQDIPAATPANAPSTSGTSNAYWSAVDTLVADKIPEDDAEPLPMGVGAQLINDWGL